MVARRRWDSLCSALVNQVTFLCNARFFIIMISHPIYHDRSLYIHEAAICCTYQGLGHKTFNKEATKLFCIAGHDRLSESWEAMFNFFLSMRFLVRLNNHQAWHCHKLYGSECIAAGCNLRLMTMTYTNVCSINHTNSVKLWNVIAAGYG